jgi:molybdenum cofactor cytidylyltransferase
MIVAIVPAAGESRRMGQPKLLLPVGGLTVIARVVSALRTGGVSRVVVVSPPHEAPEAAILQREAEDAGAEVVVPETRPPDMRASIEWGLAHLESAGPLPTTLLLAPADHPGLTPALAARVIERALDAPGAIVVPVADGRRGHPIALPWPLALAIKTLPPDAGVNALVRACEELVVEIDVDDPAALGDLDTPDDYRRWASFAAP